MTVSDIQRWDFFGEVGINEPVRYLHLEAVQGRYVTYADHVAAVAAAEQRVRDEFMDSTPELTAYRKQQYAAGVKAARDAVTAAHAVSGYDAAINWSEIDPRNEYAEGWTDLLSLILPAIDAIIDGSRNTG